MTEGTAVKVVSNGASSGVLRWDTLFGCSAPQRLPALVDQAVAWREQVLLHGDIPPAIAHDLQLAVEHTLARRAAGQQPNALLSDIGLGANRLPTSRTDGDISARPRAPAVTDNGIRRPELHGGAALPARTTRKVGASRAASLPPAASQLLPGTRLVKTHSGRNHVVIVEETGFAYEGDLFSSLSAIAKHITGTHWNGLLFFGLRKRRSYPAKPRRHG